MTTREPVEIPAHTESTIQIVGDPTVDWIVVVPPESRNPALEIQYSWGERSPARLLAQPGGAAQLSRLLATWSLHAHPGSNAPVSGVLVTAEALSNPAARTVTRTFANIGQFPERIGSSKNVWRIKEYFGQQPAEVPLDSGDEPESRVGCLLIDDANFGYRHQTERWPAFLHGRGHVPAQVILKVQTPLTGGPLWERLVERCGDSLTVCCSAGDMRKEYAPIGQALSWERTSSEVVKAVLSRAEFGRAARVIVTLGMSGAVIIERGGAASLVFDPSCQEQDWEREHPGQPGGIGTCLAAALAAEVERNCSSPDWQAGVGRGLLASRAAHECGYLLEDDRAGWGFPVEAAASAISDGEVDRHFRTVPVNPNDSWSIFVSSFPEGYPAAARAIAVEGEAEQFRGLPVERMGAWTSVDRTEIESLRSVRNIIREYMQQARRVRPLSIAVFGPPGAGKSFAIKELAREWTQGRSNISVLEFNLSQYGSADALANAFQRVRDCAVEQTLPLVFWDEFDATPGGRELGWLAQFLAPMQDGVFVDGTVSRPIGPAIFVFAGGTHATMAGFKARAELLAGVKATDFISRLRGYVDILGINPVDLNDETYLLRRTFLLRSLLLLRAPQLFSSGRLNIDPGVLRAFLATTAYVHGARSMESIIDMSSLTGKLRYERSALPARHQLALHVDAAQFLDLVHQETPV